MRIDKFLGAAGLSRTDAKKAVRAMRVTLNGAVIRDAGIDVGDGEVALDGKIISRSGHVHLMINKPAGVITATEDPRHTTVMELVPPTLTRKGLGPIGRLDKDVTGLVILTTDGQLAHRLISPRCGHEKCYLCQAQGRLTSDDCEAFESGMQLSDFTAKPARLKILSADENISVAEVTLTEGKFHQVKRMFIAIGHPLLTLKRISIAKVKLDNALELGEVRPLTQQEISTLYECAGISQEEK